jgi:signal transduction histidine kinase
VNRRTVRALLTAWFGLAVLLIVTPFIVTVLAIQWRSARAALDHHLQEDLEVAAQMLRREGLEIRWASDLPLDPGYDAGLQRWVEVFTPGHQRVFARGVAARDLVSAALPPPADRGYQTISTPAGARVRIHTAAVTIGGAFFTLRVARSEDEIRGEWLRLVALFGVGVPLAMLAAAGAGYVLSGRALKPIEESHDRLTRFTGDASHELRTPLTAIRSVGEVGLRTARSSYEYRETIGSMLEEVDRLTKLVDALLLLSRWDADRVPVSRAPVDLAELASEVTGQLAILGEERNVDVRFTATSPAMVNADRTSLRQALVNVIDNAIKYSPEDGSVDVVVSRAGGTCEVQVIDDGPGIHPDELERVFDRFYRVDKGRGREIEGVGLGLSIARRAVTANGGRISVHSDGSRGSRFILAFPALR